MIARAALVLAALAALGVMAQAPAPDAPAARRPSLPESLTMRAAMKLQRGDMAGALDDANRAILRDSHNSAAHALRGTIRMTAGNHAGAMADYSRSIELTPDVRGIEVVYTNRANLHWLERNPQAAKADLARALALNSDFGLAYNVRARLKGDAGDLDGARADFDRAIQLEPKMMPAYAGRASVHLQAGRLAESLADYKTLMWSLPGDADAVASHGIVRGLMGDTAGAVADLLRAGAMNPRSISEASRGAASSPARAVEQYIEMNPGDARAHVIRGALGLLNNKRERAEQDFGRAVAIDAARAADAAMVRGSLDRKSVV